jgi:hypothetical protein
MAVNIKCVSVEWKALGQHGEAYCVTFHVGNDTHAFDIPIWVPKETPEEDLIPKARASLHELISRVAEQTAGWKK